MKASEYAEHYFQVVEQYINNVLNDGVVCGKFEKKAVQLFLKKKEKYIYKESEVRKVFKFFSLLNINHKNKIVQFQLVPYQAFTIVNLYGLYLDEETRLIDTAILSCSKKQGKTSFLAALSIFETILDDELDANVLYVSTSTQNAKLVLNYCKLIIENSPAISSFFHIHRNEIINKQKGQLNKIEIKSSDKDLVQGLNTNFSVVDEIFYHQDLVLKDRIKSGMAARKNPLQFIIGTVNTKESLTYELYESCKNILDEVIIQDSTFAYIFQQDSIDESKYPEYWRKSSPAIDFTVNKDWLVKEFENAATSDTKKQVFLTDHLNYWSESLDDNYFIEDETIKQIMVTAATITPNAPVFLGCDFSSLNDLSAVAALSYDQDADTFYAKIYNIFPNNERNRIKKGSIDLSKWWLKTGEFENNYDDHKYIIRCESKSLDEDVVIKLIDHISNNWTIKGFGYDPFNARILATRIENELAIDCQEVKQNYTMSFPLKMIEKYIDEGRFIIDRSPVTRWEFKNVRIKTDRNNNYLINKRKGESVDAVVALTVAMTILLENNYSTFGNLLDAFL